MESEITMLSRVAETIYWLGRYHERAENLARIISVDSSLALDLPRDIQPGWGSLIAIFGLTEAYQAKHAELSEHNVIEFLVADDDNPGSIISAIASVRENARTIRETLPRKVWEHINELYQWAYDSRTNGVFRKNRYDYMDEVVRRSQMLTGALAGTMNHDIAYAFMNMGRKLERADMTTRLVDVRTQSLRTDDEDRLESFEDYQWVSLLRSMSGHQMYRRAMHTRVRRGEVLKFLFQHPHFPRSILYCIDSLAADVEHLPDNESATAVYKMIRGKLIDTPVDTSTQDELHELIDELQRNIGELHGAIAESYFLPVAGEVGC